jgi:F-type H+-transporting ATPase subunit b
MGQLFSAFGIDWRLLVINLVNFGVLLAVLYYFLYGPLTGMLEERRVKVQQGVEDAEEAARVRREVEGEREAMLAKAAQEVDELLARARARAAERERELVDEAGKRAEFIIAQAEAQAREEKAKAVAETREDVAKLIVLGMEKSLPRIIAEYERLVERDAKTAQHKEESPHQAQTRILLELYRTLTA